MTRPQRSARLPGGRPTLPVLLLVATLSAGAAIAAPAPALLSRPVVGGNAALPAHAKPRASVVGALTPAALDAARLTIGLPDGRAVIAVQIHVARDDRQQSTTWTGSIQRPDAGRVVLTRRKGTLAGFVESGDRVYEVRPAAAGQYMLFEVDAGRVPRADRLVAPKIDADGRRKSTDGLVGTLSAQFAPVVQDLLVVYTGASLSRHGQATLESMIVSAVASANEAYRTSQVGVTLNLVGVQRAAVVEGLQMDDTLSSLRADAQVQALRDQLSADLVVLVAENADFAGIAFLMTANSPQFAASAYAVVQSSALGSNVLAHEIGHLQGLAHDRETSAGTRGVYPYSFGYRRCIADGAGFRDIMSYACTNGAVVARIPQFSNPTLSYRGYATGVSYDLDPASAADGARSLNETASTVASFRAAPGPAPLPPAALIATTPAFGLVNLAWTDNSADEGGFKIERSADGVDYLEIASVGADTTTFVDRTTDPAKTYSYRVRAYNGGGVSGYSNVATITTRGLLPAAPTALVARASSGYAVDLDWVDNSDDESGFRVERSTDGATFTLVGTPSTNSTSDFNAVIPRTRYFYRVAAYNDRGVSGYSNVASATTPAELPRNPSELTARLTPAGEIQLAWRDNDANEDGYKIERAANRADWTEFATVGPDVQGYTDRAVTIGVTYAYRVRAFNAVGSSLYSSIASVATGEATPASPSGLTGSYGDGLVSLRWTDNSSNESGFRIERSTDGVSFVELVTVGPDTPRYLDRQVEAGATYYYRVRAFSPVGASSFTAPLRVSVPAPQPNPPADLRIVLVAGDAVLLAWNDASGDETGFRIERSTGAAGFVVIGTVAANERSYTDRTVAPLTSYAYAVRAFNGAGDSIQSNVVTANTPVLEPSVPAGVTAANNRKKTARVSWTANVGAPVTRYEVLREKYVKRSWRYPATVATLLPGAALSLLDPSGTGTFRYSVRACSDAGCSAYSAPAAVKVTK